MFILWLLIECSQYRRAKSHTNLSMTNHHPVHLTSSYSVLFSLEIPTLDRYNNGKLWEGLANIDHDNISQLRPSLRRDLPTSPLGELLLSNYASFKISTLNLLLHSLHLPRLPKNVVDRWDIINYQCLKLVEPEELYCVYFLNPDLLIHHTLT